ncbi:hypothetical protein [Flavobacterium sp.]|uniref:hypothetical protein n=1 Tax=Flavobacterium sp. TaxID=239 RepID=UPI00375228E6
MDVNLISELKIKFQVIIDLIAQKKIIEAQVKLEQITANINDLIDFAPSDKELQELSSYQILVNHLQLKIDILNTSLN